MAPEKLSIKFLQRLPRIRQLERDLFTGIPSFVIAIPAAMQSNLIKSLQFNRHLERSTIKADRRNSPSMTTSRMSKGINFIGAIYVMGKINLAFSCPSGWARVPFTDNRIGIVPLLNRFIQILDEHREIGVIIQELNTVFRNALRIRIGAPHKAKACKTNTTELHDA